MARQNEDVDDDKALLSATAKEEELMRQYREASEKNMAASVTLCVGTSYLAEHAHYFDRIMG